MRNISINSEKTYIHMFFLCIWERYVCLSMLFIYIYEYEKQGVWNIYEIYIYMNMKSREKGTVIWCSCWKFQYEKWGIYGSGATGTCIFIPLQKHGSPGILVLEFRLGADIEELLIAVGFNAKHSWVWMIFLLLWLQNIGQYHLSIHLDFIFPMGK